MVDQIEGQRENFPTGWPSIGLPPIDPFYIEEFNATIDTIGTLSSYESRCYLIGNSKKIIDIHFSFDFSLRDAYLVGLQQFEIENFNLRILGLALQFDVSFNQLIVYGQHVTRASLVSSQLPLLAQS